MNLEQAHALLGMLTDTVRQQQAFIEALQAEIAELKAAEETATVTPIAKER